MIRSKKLGIQVSWVDDGDRGSIVAMKPFPGYGDTIWMVGAYVPGYLLTDTLRPLRNGAIIGAVLLVVAVGLALLLGRIGALSSRLNLSKS